jgi:hypothetical protein
MVMSPAGLETTNHCAGEDRQQFNSLLPLSRCCEKLVAEAGDSSRTQTKVNVHGWKPLRSNGNEYVTVGTTVCVCNSVL